jgi:hypothetical protein
LADFFGAPFLADFLAGWVFRAAPARVPLRRAFAAFFLPLAAFLAAFFLAIFAPLDFFFVAIPNPCSFAETQTGPPGVQGDERPGTVAPAEVVATMFL